MRSIFRMLPRIMIFFILIVIVSCEKDDSDKNWGVAKIYMPQAAVVSGGINNNYPVPWSSGYGVNNYEIDSTENTIKIVLGVYQSGIRPIGGYSVHIAANVDTTNQIVDGGSVNDGVLLPEDVYTLPEEISVPDGQREATFYLTIDRSKLIAEYPDYYNKKLLLAVNISNASKYELNDALSTTVVVIDAKEFMPEPPKVNLIQGGDMEASTEKYWTRITQNSGIDADRTLADISFTGVLSWSNGDGSVTGDDLIYQTLQVTQGKSYQFSADVTSSGAVNSFFEIYFGTTKPSVGDDYSDNYYIGFNVWNGTQDCFKNKISGNMAEVGCSGPGVGAEGMFTASMTGTIYFVIKAGSYGGNLGSITMDNIEVVEVP